MNTAAPACKKALTDATRRWPNRNRASDGILGDVAHQKRKSDHNLGNAFDLTHDLEHHVDCFQLQMAVMKDTRVTYLIFNGQIWKARTGKWEVYRGPNPHRHHMHVSIKPESRNDLSPWPWSPGNEPTPNPVLREGDTGSAVKELQEKLKAHGAVLQVDGRFGRNTTSALKAFQKAKGLSVDGIAGAEVWAKLNG